MSRDKPKYESLNKLLDAVKEGKLQRENICFLVDRTDLLPQESQVTVVESHGFDRHGDPYDPTLLLEGGAGILFIELCARLGFSVEDV